MAQEPTYHETTEHLNALSAAMVEFSKGMAMLAEETATHASVALTLDDDELQASADSIRSHVLDAEAALLEFTNALACLSVANAA